MSWELLPLRFLGRGTLTLCRLEWHAHDCPFPPQGNLRRVDVQLLGQLCNLGLEMGALREELVAFLEEEAEENTEEEEEEDRELKGKLEGASSPIPGHHRPPDFEMTI